MDLDLSVTGLSTDRREIGVFYYFIMLMFCMFDTIKFVKKVFDVAMSTTKLNQSEVNNTHVFVISGMDNFPDNRSCYKAVTSCQK